VQEVALEHEDRAVVQANSKMAEILVGSNGRDGHHATLACHLDGTHLPKQQQEAKTNNNNNKQTKTTCKMIPMSFFFFLFFCCWTCCGAPPWSSLSRFQTLMMGLMPSSSLPTVSSTLNWRICSTCDTVTCRRRALERNKLHDQLSASARARVCVCVCEGLARFQPGRPGSC
jgi:hypothetical protein